MKVTVYMTSVASFTIDVEVPDGLDQDEAKERAIEQAYEAVPGDVCAQCSGWRQPWELELGEWEPYEGDGGPVSFR